MLKRACELGDASGGVSFLHHGRCDSGDGDYDGDGGGEQGEKACRLSLSMTCAYFTQGC